MKKQNNKTDLSFIKDLIEGYKIGISEEFHDNIHEGIDYRSYPKFKLKTEAADEILILIQEFIKSCNEL